MSDSWIARKLDAQFDGRYLISSFLMTSTMKSEPAVPPIRAMSFGVPVSAAIVCAVGGSDEGKRTGAVPAAAVAACGVTVLAAPASATPVRNLRRSTLTLETFRPLLLDIFVPLVSRFISSRLRAIDRGNHIPWPAAVPAPSCPHRMPPPYARVFRQEEQRFDSARLPGAHFSAIHPPWRYPQPSWC